MRRFQHKPAQEYLIYLSHNETLILFPHTCIKILLNVIILSEIHVPHVEKSAHLYLTGIQQTFSPALLKGGHVRLITIA